MASFIPLIALLIFTAHTVAGAADFAKTTAYRATRAEKLTHIRLYWHDILSGRSPTSVPIIRPPPPKANATFSFFGATNMIDNPLTAAPAVGSELVGRAQGLYSVASQGEVAMLMAMNFAFTGGDFNGSSIAVLGRNPVMEKVREMPVVGGSGVFRYARGYVEARTHSWDPMTGDATVEYNCYVLHY